MTTDNDYEYSSEYNPLKQTLKYLIPIDPKLPDHFTTAEISERSWEELCDWLGVVFIVTLPKDLGFEVQVLNGGANDRPYYYPHHFDTIEEAIELAHKMIKEGSNFHTMLMGMTGREFEPFLDSTLNQYQILFG